MSEGARGYCVGLGMWVAFGAGIVVGGDSGIGWRATINTGLAAMGIGLALLFCVWLYWQGRKHQ